MQSTASGPGSSRTADARKFCHFAFDLMVTKIQAWSSPLIYILIRRRIALSSISELYGHDLAAGHG